MKRRTILKAIATGIPVAGLAKALKAGTLFSSGLLPKSGDLPATQSILNGQRGAGSIAAGPFQPNWNSLQQYVVPNWFRDAKFGIWAHWGPQCQPEYGDWYARSMYIEGSRDYKYHLKKYGHPSKFGFKDVIGEWKAEKWNPDELVELYRRAGAKYFMALANHHDNFD